MMESEVQCRGVEPRLTLTISPRRQNSRKRGTESDIGDEALRIQLEAANKRIVELESELQRALQAETRSRRRIIELRSKYTQQLEVLTARLTKPKAQLPETVSLAVNENLASVAFLHSQLQEELSAFQVKTEQKLKSKEMLLQQNYDARLKLLGRNPERRGEAGESSPPLTERNPELFEGKLKQFEDFNSKLQASNAALKRKLKEAQALAEVYAEQHAAILLENARLKRLLQEKKDLPNSHRSSVVGEFPHLGRVQRDHSEGVKLGELQKELSKVRAQLVEERIRNAETELASGRTSGFQAGHRSERPSRERMRSELTDERAVARALPSGRSASVTTFEK